MCGEYAMNIIGDIRQYRTIRQNFENQASGNVRALNDSRIDKREREKTIL